MFRLNECRLYKWREECYRVEIFEMLNIVTEEVFAYGQMPLRSNKKMYLKLNDPEF